MPPITQVRELDIAEALYHVDEDHAAVVDFRPVPEYLDVHIPGSLALVYEFGPGMAGRARDCLPLWLPLVLLDHPDIDMRHAAGALRGKGFDVVGYLRDGINRWAAERGRPASIEILEDQPASSGTLLHVGDAGAAAPEGALSIPIERLWDRVGDVPREAPVTIVGGYGVRAALAVGILERAGIGPVSFWKTVSGPLAGALTGRHGHPIVT